MAQDAQMTNTKPTGQADKPYSTRRKRRRSPKHGPRFPRCALYRPGRFFRTNRRLEMYRLDMNPRHLGEADWMLYRRPFNPYRKRLRAHSAYNAGYRIAKREIPKPNWPAISW